MKKSKLLSIILLLSFVASPLFGGVQNVIAQSGQGPTVSAPKPAQGAAPNDEFGTSNTTGQMRTTTMAMRIAAALHLNIPHYNSNVTYAGLNPDTAQYSPLANVGAQVQAAPDLTVPDYFASANYANSPLPQLDPLTGAVLPNTGIRKFQDTLPGLCLPPYTATNNIGQCIPLADPTATVFDPNSDYYEIAVVEYREQLSSSLPAVTGTTGGTQLRGYVQIVPSTYTGAVQLFYPDGITPIHDNAGNPVYGATKPHYLGPMIVATGCSLVANPTTCKPRPVRVKFDNYLPTGPAGNLFLPTDVTYMGAGMGPGGSILSVSIPTGGGGTGYTSAPNVVFTNAVGDLTGTGAAASATVINGAVTAVTVTNGGSGYSAAPTVGFSGGGGTGATATAVWAGPPGFMYSQNRATLHLHGGNTPWISDGTTHQWTTPNGENQFTAFTKGDSVAYVPDMWFDGNGVLIPSCSGFTTCAVAGSSNDPGLGSLTFYWTNQQSGRLLFYHDHAYGTTRLDVYAGEAAGYLIADPTEDAILAAAGIPGAVGITTPDLSHLIPLIIQDKTFVPDPATQLLTEDPTWNVTAYGGLGNLWFPHVYTPNQNPADITGANAFGRWDYGPWFWPPQDPTSLVSQPVPCTSAAYTTLNPPAFPPLLCPGMPDPSGTPESFMDTPVINGTAYPTLTVDPTAYRFQMLMAGNDRTWNLGLYQAEPLSIAVTNGGSGYVITPTVSLNPAGGLGTNVVAELSHGSVSSILLTNVGTLYTAAPNVVIGPPNCSNGLGCVNATATASIDPITGTVEGIKITNPGSGYTAVPAVSLTGGTTGTNALATAFVTQPGVVVGVKVINPGATPWTVVPTVSFVGTSTTPATAIASINSEVKMVPAVPHDATSAVPLCGQANLTSGAQLALALTDASGGPVNGTGLPAGCWPTTWPTDGRDGGVPDPLTAGPAIIQIGSESGMLPAPVMIPSTPVGYEYNRRSITVLNVYTHGLLMGPAERADVVVDFSQYAGQTLLLYNDAPAPVPAFDSRTDYYTGDPDQTMAGGAPTTLPGYGPNTRTIMQIKVNATLVNPPAIPFSPARANTAVSKVFNTQQNPIIVPEPTFQIGGNGYATNPTYSRISDTSIPGFFNGQIGSIVLSSSGSGYTFAPNVSLQGGGGTGATAGITFQGANVSNLTVTLGGAGYSSPPTVIIAPPGPPTGTTATASALLDFYVNAVAVTNPGSGYNVAPTVSFGGPGSGATATANLDKYVNTVTVTNRGSGYTSAPTVGFTGGTPVTAATATANFTKAVNSVTLTGVFGGGSGYSSAPTVNFSGGGGGGAAATATISGVVNTVNVVTQGLTYSSPPTVVFTGGGGSGAAATANLLGGRVRSITITNRGSGYTSAPVVTFTGGGGSGATATATITGAIVSVAVTNGGAGYASAPNVSFTGGGGSGAAVTSTITGVVASVTVTSGGTGYQSTPLVSFTGGGCTTNCAAATASLSGRVASVSVTNGGTGFTSAPVSVSFTPVNGGSGAAATASTTGKVSQLLISNAGSGYTANPGVTIAAPTCVPGPTCVQATASATYTPGSVASIFMINLGTGYTSAPSVIFTTLYPPTSAATAYVVPPLIPLGAKAIQELFTLDYGRMNATLGVEIPFTNFFVQTTIPYGYVDPPTEMFKSGDTIFWKITHNGVDTHFIHFHLYDLQVVNRVGWDGMIKPPDANEMAWKDTVRMNPLEDIIVAMRPMKQVLPWELPNSYRPMDVTESIGASNPNNTAGFANIDPSNAPAPVNNDVINFGWEYVVHCHILGHEENDMMRPQLLAVPPDPVSNVTATRQGGGQNQSVLLTWVDGSINETGFTVQRATTPNGPWLDIPASPAAPGAGTVLSFTDTTIARRTTYYYQVVANNVVGYTQTYTAPAIGYPTLSADSVPVAAPAPITILANGQPGPIFADSFETGLNMWTGNIGNSNISTLAMIGPNGGTYGMVSTIGPNGQAAYVYDGSPNAEVMYDGNFYFNPNKAVTSHPVDIFLGIDQNGQPVFGVQYKYVDANSFMLRAWLLRNGFPAYSSWDVFTVEPGEDNPVQLTHKLDVAWMSGVSGGLSFYVDDHLFASVSGDTSASQLEEVLLGPSLGLSAGDSGSMYFDEFTSSRVPGLTYEITLPVVAK